MRKFFICLLFIAFSQKGYCQQTDTLQSLLKSDSLHPVSKEALLKKSYTQITAAWIMVGAGTATFLIAAIYTTNHLFEETPGAEAAAVIGAGVAIGSIPLFIAAHRNKKKAQNVSVFFKYIKQDELVRCSNLKQPAYYPAMALRINF